MTKGSAFAITTVVLSSLSSLTGTFSEDVLDGTEQKVERGRRRKVSAKKKS